VANHLTYHKHTRVANATAAGVTAINCTSVDMSDFEGVVGICCMGTLTATQVTSLKAQSSSDNSTWADITGAVTANAADADSNKELILEVYRPQKRYVRFVVQRATANAVIDSVDNVQYGPKFAGVTQDAATVSASKIFIGI